MGGMPTGRLRRVAAAHRGPILFTLGLLLVIVALFLVPGGGEDSPEFLPLITFPDEPKVRILLQKLWAGDSAVIEGRNLRALAPGSASRDLPAGPVTVTADGVFAGGEPLPIPCRIREGGGGDIGVGKDAHAGVIDLVAGDGCVLVVNRVPIETYLEGVVAAEMGSRFHLDALKAQAVAARSYAAHRMLSRKDASYDLGDDQGSQVYRGRKGVGPACRSAVSATRALVLAWQDRVLEGLFSSSCGGSTRPAGEAFGGRTETPLRGGACGHCDGAPGARWDASADAREAGRELGVAALKEVLAVERHPSGRPSLVTFLDEDGARIDAGPARLRQILSGTKSSWITGIRIEGGRLLASGLGFGHGVGLCQYGAERLARDGTSWPGILALYFPGASIRVLYPVAAG